MNSSTWVVVLILLIGFSIGTVMSGISIKMSDTLQPICTTQEPSHGRSHTNPFVILEQFGEPLTIRSTIVTDDATWMPNKPIVGLDDLEVNNSYYARVTFFLPSSFIINENSTYALKIEDAGKSTIIKFSPDEWYHVDIFKKSEERYCAKLIEIDAQSGEKIIDYSGVGCFDSSAHCIDTPNTKNPTSYKGFETFYHEPIYQWVDAP